MRPRTSGPTSSPEPVASLPIAPLPHAAEEPLGAAARLAAPVAGYDLVPSPAAGPDRVPSPTAGDGALPRVVLELSGARGLDDAAVAVLAEARDVVEAAGRTFVLASPSAAALASLAAAGGDLLRSVEPAPIPADETVERDALVRDNRALAEQLAGRFTGRGQPLEDLRQVAYVGLILAARRFDPARGVAFSTYAHATIAGELKRHFRDHAWQLHVSRPVQELYLAVRTTTESLTHELGRAPTPSEVAVHLGVAEEQVVESLEARAALSVGSLDAVRDGDGDDNTGWRERAAPEPGYDTVEERSWLVPALRALPERERRILKLRFFDGLSQSAIAAQVGISQMHVSRLLARSLRQLRAAAGE